MNASVYRIFLDVHDAHSSVCLDMKQQDTARQISITLTDGGFPYQIGEECYAVFAATKADGKKLLHHCSIERNTILYDVRPQTTAALGLCECEIRLYGSGDKLLLSPGFNILVSENAVEDEEIVSQDEVDALTHLISEATTVITEGKNVNAKGKEVNAEAEALIADMEAKRATLEQQIADTGASAGAANKSAMRAESAATSASSSASLAAIKAKAAADSADSAKASEEAAETSATTAVNMANNAYNHQQAAETAAEEARQHAEQVAASEEAAETSASSAATMAESARKYADTAEHAAYKASQYSSAADLAQNDPDVPGYIKNRTHWVESSETVIAWDGNVTAKRTYTDDLGKTYYKIYDQCPEESDVIGATIEFSGGDTQTVISKMFSGFTDGQGKVGGYIYLRSTPVVSAGNVIDADSVGVYAAIVNDVYPAIFRYGKDVVHTLDEKFIPDTIARKSDRQNSSQNANGGLSTTAANLLIEILESAVYNTNVSGKIVSLKEALASGGASGGNTGGGSGDSGGDSGGETVADDITVADGVMTIIAVGSAVNVADGVMTIA